VKELPRTENALVVRTDFSDAAAWDAVCRAIQEPVGEDEFRAYVDFLSDPGYDGLSPEQLRGIFPGRYDHSFIFLVDRVALTHPEHPILVVDLHEEGPEPEQEAGRPFRVVPSEVWGIENNLSIANMDFADFANAVDQYGVFRGFRDG